MDRMILLFPEDSSGDRPDRTFALEFECAVNMPFYDVVLFDTDKAFGDKQLVLDRQPDYSKAPAIYRGPRLTINQYESLYEAAKNAGIRMITDEWRYTQLHRFAFNNYHVLGEKHRDTPVTYDISRDSRASMCSWGFRRTLSVTFNENSNVANSHGRTKVIKDLDAESRVISVFEKIGEAEFDCIRESRLNDSDAYGLYRNLIMQEWVDLKRYGEATNEWRGRFFDGQMFELLPNSGQPVDAPKPPQRIIDAHRSESPYFELDFAELCDGDWLIIGSDDGQVAKLARGQSVEEYYSSLERVARKSPHLPEWIWCLVANISEECEYTKKDGTTIKGTKHFRPGAKIYIGSTWHGGYDWWKFVVMGKPRHQRRLIQIYMDWDKLCNFRLKKVYDKRVIEHMTRFDRGTLRLGASPEVHGGWDNTDESKREILEWVTLLNQAYSERMAAQEKGALPKEDSQ